MTTRMVPQRRVLTQGNQNTRSGQAEPDPPHGPPTLSGNPDRHS